MGEPTTTLADHLAWLDAIAGKPCTGCRYEWLPSRDYGHMWVRITADPGCPEHGEESRG